MWTNTSGIVGGGGASRVEGGGARNAAPPVYEATQRMHQQQHRQQQQMQQSGGATFDAYLAVQRQVSPTCGHGSIMPPLAEAVGVVRINDVMVQYMVGVLQLLESVPGIRVVIEQERGRRLQNRLDITYVERSPHRGLLFVVFTSHSAAQEFVNAYPHGLGVGADERVVSLPLQLSSVPEMMAAQQQQHQVPGSGQHSVGSGNQQDRTIVSPAPLAEGEENRIYWLRGLPFLTSSEDVEALLRDVPYIGLEIGRLVSGECSGNLFLELRGSHGCEQVERLHHTHVACAAHNLLEGLDRPKPRFVEVILSNATQRAEQLTLDAATTRKDLAQSQRGRVPHKRHGHANPAATRRPDEPRIYSHHHHQQQQQQQQYQPQQQYLQLQQAPRQQQPIQPVQQRMEVFSQQQQPQQQYLRGAPMPERYFLVQNAPQVSGAASPHVTTHENSLLDARAPFAVASAHAGPSNEICVVQYSQAQRHFVDGGLPPQHQPHRYVQVAAMTTGQGMPYPPAPFNRIYCSHQPRFPQ